MNRQLKRRQERLNGAGTVKKEISEEILKQVEKQLNDGRVEAMMLCFALGLHKEFRFGKERCLKALKSVDDLMKPWISGKSDLTDLRDRVINEIGIDVRC